MKEIRFSLPGYVEGLDADHWLKKAADRKRFVSGHRSLIQWKNCVDRWLLFKMEMWWSMLRSVRWIWAAGRQS